MRFLREITDRRPVLSGWVIVLLYTVLPMIAMALSRIFLGRTFNIELIVLLYAFAIQLILWRNVEQFILVMLPFVLMLIGLILGEIAASICGGLPAKYDAVSSVIYLCATAVIQLCGTEVCGILGAMLANALICMGKTVWEAVTGR